MKITSLDGSEKDINMPVNLEDVLVYHIDEAIRLELDGKQYLNWLSYIDKVEKQVEDFHDSEVI